MICLKILTMWYFCEVIMAICLSFLTLYKNLILTPRICFSESEMPCFMCEERIPTRCNNIDDLFSIPDVDY